MKYYIVGLHKGGTHSYAKYLAQRNHALFLDEGKIRWNDLEAAILLAGGKFKDHALTKSQKDKIYKLKDKNFVLQCPGLSHKTIELAKYGKVIWVSRSVMDTAHAMKNDNFSIMAWDIMKDFRIQWPDDPVWKILKYDSKGDIHCKFIGYFTLLIQVKEYFYEKYLKRYANRVFTEKQPYYDVDKTTISKRPLRQRDKDMIEKHIKLWEECYASLCID